MSHCFSVDDNVEPWRTRPKRTTTTSTTTTTTKPPTTTPRTSGKDLIFMLDSSVTPEIFGWMKTYVYNMVKNMSIDNEEYRVGFMTFGNNPTAEAHLNRYKDKESALRGVNRIRYTPGRTNTDRAIDYVRQYMFTTYRGDRDFARNLVVLLTANDQSADRYRTWEAAENAEKSGINLYTVGINLRDTTEIDETSSHPLSEYRHLLNTNMNNRTLSDSIDGILGLGMTTHFFFISNVTFILFMLCIIVQKFILISFSG